MISRKIWITLLSIISVALMITASVSATIATSLNFEEKSDENNLSVDSDSQAESGRISLDKKAEIETKPDIDPSESADQIIDTIRDESNTDTSSETGNDQGIDDSDVNEDIPEESSEPSGDLIWLAIEGDEVSDDDSEIPGASSNGSGSNTISGDIEETIATSPQIQVDEVFIASNGIVDKTLAVDSSLALNILGYAEIEVISGSDNLIDGPYFNGIDVFDRISLTAASTLTMFLVRIIQVLDIVFPLADAIIISTTICAWILEKAAYVIQNGLDLSTQIININLTITIGGHTYTLTNSIRNAIINLLTPILNILDIVVKSLTDYVEQSVSNIIDYLQNLKTLFLNTDFRGLIKDLYESSSLAVHAILLVLQNKDTTQIQAWLEKFVSPWTARTLVSVLNFYDYLFVSIRDGIFGKFDAFMTYGRDSTPLRSIYAKVDPNCQVEEGQYAAIIKIKAISAGKVFDNKTIGILLDGSGENIPDSDENLSILSGSTTIGSTTTTSTTIVLNDDNNTESNS